MDFHHDKISSSMELSDFVRVLYPKQNKYRVACAHFLKLVGEKEFAEGYDITKMCSEKKISRASLQKVFVRLRALGLVEKRNGRYFLSNEFASASRRLGDAWRGINKNKKFNFDEDFLKVNF